MLFEILYSISAFSKIANPDAQWLINRFQPEFEIHCSRKEMSLLQKEMSASE